MWRSMRIPNVVLSSAEAEYCAQCEGGMDAVFLANLLSEMQIPVTSPVRMWCDNRSAIAMANSLKSSIRSRHIDIKYHYVRELVEREIVTLEWVASGEMLADILTKPLGRMMFAALCSRLLCDERAQ